METETFQHYQVLRREDGSPWELGRGAMAVTYKAIDNNLRCPVALKVVSAVHLRDDHTRARFVREARAAAGLRHRNIAGVHHLGSDAQSYFYAMEFIDGETVEDRVARRGPLPPAEALGIAAQVARALGAAAKQGLVHRDIKPANVMVVREDEDESLIVKVIDFGLARRAVVSDQAARITLSGFVGTPQYASPEQIAERDLDTRSDIYSLGVTLWFMLAGQPPFSGPLARICSQHLNNEPPWAAVGHLSAPTRALLARMLQKDPADRPQDPSTLRREIEACLAESDTPVPTGAAPVPVGGVSPPGGTTIDPRAGEPATRISPGDIAGDETLAVQTPDAVPQGPAPATGEFFGERFRLLDFVGEGSTGRVFRAADGRHGDRAVAVKVFRPDPGVDRREFHRLRGDLRRLRAAPHPRLIEVFALDQARGYRFMASEWINGFTLVDLLRHRGRLELPEALRLLEDASDAAAHGSANGLHRLEFAPHQVFVHFPAGFDGERARTVRAIVDRPLARWPKFGLKIGAVAPAGETGQTPHGAGALTLVPSRPPGRDPGSSIRGRVEGGYFHALGSLLHEMLGGTPPPDAGREVPPLPALSEAANDVLRRALSATPDLRHEREFLDALLAAGGLERGDLRCGPEAGARPSPATVAGDAACVPSSGPLVRAGSTISAPPVVPLRMAPTIRTKLLRPRGLRPTESATPPAGEPPRRTARWMVAAGAAGLFVIAAWGGYLLLPGHPARPGSTPIEAPTAPLEKAVPPSPSPADDSSPSTP